MIEGAAGCVPMSQLQVKRVLRDVIDHAEEAVVPESGLGKVIDDFLVQRLKQDELEHAEVDPRLYEGLRQLTRAEVLPLYEQYRAATARVRERKQNRKIWHYVVGTVAALEVLQAILTRGRSIAPPVLIPTAILHSFIGFILYTAAQYIDDLQINRARKRLERSLEHIDVKIQTDVDYDNRRQLLDADVLRAEALEMLVHYKHADEFWREYRRVREADPTVPAAVKALNAPAFERFLKYHVDGTYSESARQHRFNRLFLEAHEVFISRDREKYVLTHLRKGKS